MGSPSPVPNYSEANALRDLGIRASLSSGVDLGVPLTAALGNRNYRGEIFLPGGGYRQSTTVSFDNRSGGRIRGAGWTRDGSEDQYTGSGWGGSNTTRVLWYGDATSPQFYGGKGHRQALSDMLIKGNVSGQNVCKVGFHYKPDLGGQGTPGASHLELNNVKFEGHDICILARRDYTATPGAGGDFDGDSDLHADNMNFGKIALTDFGTCGLWIGTDQSVGNHIRNLEIGSVTYPKPGVYIDRGGKTIIDYLNIQSNCVGVEIRHCTSNNDAIQIGYVLVDAVTTNCSIIKFKNNASNGDDRNEFCAVSILGGMRPYSNDDWTGILIDCGTPSAGRHCVINLHNFHYIPPASIRLNGWDQNGTAQYNCILNCYNCGIMTDSNNPEECLTADSDTLYQANFINCYALGDTLVESGGVPVSNTIPFYTQYVTDVVEGVPSYARIPIVTVQSEDFSDFV